MNARSILTALLLLFAAGSMAYVLLGTPGGSTGGEAPAPTTANTAPSPAAPAPELIVYYMDMGKDCTTCLNLETYTHEALQAGFPEEMASGRIQWRTVDVDDPKNEHFISDFRLYTKSVVLVRQAEGAPPRFESLSRIWELVYDKEAYMAYIRKSVRAFLDTPGSPE